MPTIERYREWYEYERDCNQKMLAMLQSVPANKRSDARFARATVLAAHLAACRENWLVRMKTSREGMSDWWPEEVSLDALGPRYARLEADWTKYLGQLTDQQLERDFEFTVAGGTRYRWSIEGQIVQLYGHAHYHRGQIAQLVDELGGQSVDTDYLYWALPCNPRYGQVSDNEK